MASEKFCLRWNDFENNINSAFKELRDDKDFFDVTLACDDEQIQAHKVILSACSPFFKTILRRNPHQHPLLYLKDVRYTDLQSVLNFMYHGEVNVAQEELNSFLSVAENLKVKGLTQNQTGSKPVSQDTHSTNPVKDIPTKNNPRPVQAKPAHSVTSSKLLNTPAIEEDEIQEVIPIKSEPKDLPVPQPVAPAHQTLYSNTLATEDEHTLAYTEDSYDDYGEYPEEEHEQYQGASSGMATGNEGIAGYAFQDPSELLQFVRKDPADQKFYCSLCDKFSHKASYNTRNHVESHHFPNMFSYQCDQCDKSFATKSNFLMHRSRKHKPVKLQGLYTQIQQ